MSDPVDICPLCGGSKRPGKTTFSADIGSGVVVVRNVNAMICSQCGEEWIANDGARQLEEIVLQARQRNTEIEVVALGDFQN